jgi:hypothetical protein
MSTRKAAQSVRRMFDTLHDPPAETETLGNLQRPVARGRPKGEPTVQLNLRVPPDVKMRVRLLAARDGLSLSELIIRAIALYEEEHGAAPKV